MLNIVKKDLGRGSLKIVALLRLLYNEYTQCHTLHTIRDAPPKNSPMNRGVEMRNVSVLIQPPTFYSGQCNAPPTLQGQGQATRSETSEI